MFDSDNGNWPSCHSDVGRGYSAGHNTLLYKGNPYTNLPSSRSINASANTSYQGCTKTSLQSGGNAHTWAHMSETGQVMGFMKDKVQAQEKVQMLKSNARGMTFRPELTPKPQH